MIAEDFNLFSAIVKKRSGLFLAPDKAYLLQSRLSPVARKHGFASIEELARSIRAQPKEIVLADITEAMTTNESSFFRDQKPFNQFRQWLLPTLLKARASKKRIRIWSAASSSGQEAYSLAMICAEEAAKLQGWTIEIIGTDISPEMVKRSQAGIFSQFEVQRGLSIAMLVKYFTQLGNDRWQIKEPLRKMVRFQEGNLLEDFNALGVFDIIFCRNVLIYFERADKARVLEALYSCLSGDGTLILGGAETVLNISDKFKPMETQQGLYVSRTQSAPLAALA